MDGLPGMRRGIETGKREDVKPVRKMVGPFAPEVMPRRSPTRLAFSQILMVLLAFCMGVVAQYGWRHASPQAQKCKA